MPSSLANPATEDGGRHLILGYNPNTTFDEGAPAETRERCTPDNACRANKAMHTLAGQRNLTYNDSQNGDT
ncbi:protein of unknown function [Acidithiobacillus ferrivorans]|uniref:Uncharacterized protein n=1 Tax=Acidithiobacillus ferrivorans TaxID=160808 RepID=A0A060UJY5_9PROT|nr:hypothetical protein AFERRI_100141 [Acidithiobacillus ferrivorans]SMH66910.1 protein of unknown function [Acidithiobacillus ferrivorans]